MKFKKECKHSVVYEATLTDERKTNVTFYVPKIWLPQGFMPDQVELTLNIPEAPNMVSTATTQPQAV